MSNQNNYTGAVLTDVQEGTAIAQPKKLSVRKSILAIQKDYDNGNKEELENLMRAWHGIKALPHNDPNSFFTIGGFHGEPFRGKGATDKNYWGGYCNHGNVLFPTWHRAYLHRIEQALQSIKGCEEVTLPYWDQTDEHSLKIGIPSCLTDEYFTFSDGTTIPNPLRSFVFPVNIDDAVEDNLYTKPKGYETVRYPLSGLVGTPQDIKETEKHNATYEKPDGTINYDKTTPLLNGNVKGWLNGTIILPGTDKPIGTGTASKYLNCLKAPNYTVFSNTTSARAWNKDPKTKSVQVTPLESPHNEIHLSVGGFDVPGQGDLSVIDGANGDMGENETAGLDPIFFFHHCNVDRVFWIWQVRNGHTNHFDIEPGYAGTDNVDNQPPVGYEPDTPLNMDSPLYPFKLSENGIERDYKSNDCINIETQMGFTYDSLEMHEGAVHGDDMALAAKATRITPKKSSKVLVVDGINRAKFKGSFIINAFATINGVRHFLGYEAILSRWNVQKCKNCQTNLEVSTTFSLAQFTDAEIANAHFDIEIKGRKIAANETLLKTKSLDTNMFNLKVI